MPLLKKHILGLLLTLVGGLALAHGLAVEERWEVILGLLVLATGVALLVLKIARRNTPAAG